MSGACSKVVLVGCCGNGCVLSSTGCRGVPVCHSHIDCQNQCQQHACNALNLISGNRHCQTSVRSIDQCQHTNCHDDRPVQCTHKSREDCADGCVLQSTAEQAPACTDSRVSTGTSVTYCSCFIKSAVLPPSRLCSERPDTTLAVCTP